MSDQQLGSFWSQRFIQLPRIVLPPGRFPLGNGPAGPCGPCGPCGPAGPCAPAGPCGPRLPLSCLIAVLVSRFLAIVCGLISFPLINVAAANDVPPSARNSASSAIALWRRKRPNPLVI